MHMLHSIGPSVGGRAYFGMLREHPAEVKRVIAVHYVCIWRKNNDKDDMYGAISCSGFAITFWLVFAMTYDTLIAQT